MSNKLDVIMIGDCYYVVPVFVTEWITSAPKETSTYENIPEKVIEHFGIFDEDSKVRLGMFTYENDRALCITGYAPMFESMSDVFEYFQNSKFVMGEEFHYEEY